MANDYDFDDDDKPAKGSGGGRFKEFDCPDCNANNPVHEPFGDKDEVRCNYCGTEYRVTLTAEGRVKFKEL